MYRKLILATLSLMTVMPAAAQSEAGLLMELGAEKKVSKKFSIGLDAELRTRNNLKTMDRWSLGINAEYKPWKFLKLGIGYTLLDNNFRESISYKANGSYNNWRPSYWGIRHRLHASATATYKFSNGLRLSLRERWQYTYRPEKTVTRWDFDNSWWEDDVRSGKGKNQLRSRLQLEYDKKGALLTPYTNMELYNSWGVEKIRYSIGTDFNLSKQHKLTLFYRFQDMKNGGNSDNEPDMHYIGVGYQFKF